MQHQASAADAPICAVSDTPLSESDMAAARRFAGGCYDDSIGLPSKEAMERLERAGVVQRLPQGGWADTPRLRQLGL